MGALIYIVIFIAFLYWLCNKYGYWTNVIAYTIGMGLIYTLLFNFISIPSLFWAIIIRFITGLILIKILDKVNSHFQSGVYFLIIGGILEYFIIRFVLATLVAFIVLI